MSQERIETEVSTRSFIEKDLATNGHQTFDAVVKEIQKRSKAEEDIFALSGSYATQIDIGVGTDRIYRLSFKNFERYGEKSKLLSVWMVDEKGRPESDLCHIDNYPDKTSVIGSSRNNPEGYNLKIEPADLAAYLDRAIAKLNDFNWRIVTGS
jgi:hypothetical protein